MIHVSPRTYSHYENNEREMSLDTWKLLSKLLEKSIDYLSIIEEKKKDNSFEKVVKTAEDIKEDIKNAVDESGIKEKVKNTVKNSVEKIDNKLDNIRESVVSVSEMSDRFDDVESKISNIAQILRRRS